MTYKTEEGIMIKGLLEGKKARCLLDEEFGPRYTVRIWDNESQSTVIEKWFDSKAEAQDFFSNEIDSASFSDFYIEIIDNWEKEIVDSQGEYKIQETE